MKNLRIVMLVILCLVVIGALVAGCGGGKSGGTATPSAPPGGYTGTFVETFDGMATATDIYADQSKLDNPTSFSATMMPGSIFAGREAGALALDNGTAESPGANSQRVGFTVPGLNLALAPVLKLTVKNASANAITIFVGDSYVTSGTLGVSGHRAYAEQTIPANSGYTIYSITLNTAFISSGVIQLRPVIGTSGTGAAGISIDKIEVTGLPDVIPSPSPSVEPSPSPSEEPSPSPSGEPSPSPSEEPSPSPLGNVFSDNFNSATSDTLLTPSYKTLTSDSNIAMYSTKSGSVSIDNGGVLINAGRFVIGAKSSTDTTATTTPGGDFNLSSPWKISFKIVAITGDTTKKIQVCVDNNTTGQANSPLGGGSRLYSEAASTLTVGQTLTVSSSLGSTASFVMIRLESGLQITIDDLVIEYQ